MTIEVAEEEEFAEALDEPRRPRPKRRGWRRRRGRRWRRLGRRRLRRGLVGAPPRRPRRAPRHAGRPAGRRARATRGRSTRAPATTSAPRWSAVLAERHGGTAEAANGACPLDRRGQRRPAGAWPWPSRPTYMNDSGRPCAAARAPLRHRGRPRDSWSSSTTSSTCRPAASRSRSAAGWPATTACARSRHHLHTDDFVRVRIGVGKPPVEGAGRRPRAAPARQGASGRSWTIAVQEAADAVEVIVAEGVERRWNGSTPVSRRRRQSPAAAAPMPPAGRLRAR